MKKLTSDSFVKELRKIVPEFTNYNEASTLTDSPYMDMADFDAILEKKLVLLEKPQEDAVIQQVIDLINQAFSKPSENEELTTLIHTTVLEKIAEIEKCDVVAHSLLKGNALDSYKKIRQGYIRNEGYTADPS